MARFQPPVAVIQHGSLAFGRAGWCKRIGIQRVPCTPETSDYVSMGRYPFVLRLAVPGELDTVVGLVREAAGWLASKGIDQWQEPWPDLTGQRERILNDLSKGKTWLVQD